MVPLPPLDLLTFCRVLTVLQSLIVDVGIHVVSSAVGTSAKLALLLHSISHISIVFLTRSFTNAWETQLQSLLLTLVFGWRHSAGSALLQGVLCGVGTFCRPTFVLFAAPIILWRVAALSRDGLAVIFRYALAGVVGVVMASAALIYVDSLLYDCVHVPLTPLNFVVYNVRRDNLRRHGLHPPFTHAVANVPLMLGVLAPLAYVCPFVLAFGAADRCSETRSMLWAVVAAVGVPLAALSTSPHQEMRFLLPLYPLAVVMATVTVDRLVQARLGRRRPLVAVAVLLVLHAVTSGGAVAFWGYWHEGGLLPAVTAVRGGDCVAVVTYRTLTLPQFPLLHRHRHRDSPLSPLSPLSQVVHNLMGVDEAQFWGRTAAIVQRLRDHGHRRHHHHHHHQRKPCQLHLIFPKAYSFRHRHRWPRLGHLVAGQTVVGHVNTDLWPPRGSWTDFVSLQRLTFSV